MAKFDLELFKAAVLSDELVYDIWDQKYRLKRPDGGSDEHSVADTQRRYVQGVYAKDPNVDAFNETLWLVQNGYLTGAGRVIAGAGTGRAVTLINCYVSGTISDSMPAIQRSIGQTALTMQQGGGNGSDFSTIRPAGALVGRTGSVSSGVLPFADEQNMMCGTIVSAGTRRGAMMLTLRDDHPDLWNPEQYETTTNFHGETILRNPSFISAKRQRGRLTNFNVSVLVSDAFMRAVEDDLDWDLGFHVPRADGVHVAVYDKPFPYDYIPLTNAFEQGDDRAEWKKGAVLPWYVYRRVKARTIWEDMMRSTYTYAEPGVIFIDRVNDYNNLWYCEDIRCTNPCFTGDTKVWTIDGPKRFDELAASGADVAVLTELPGGALAYRMMSNPRLTQQAAKLIEITFKASRGRPGARRISMTTLRCTPSHEFFTVDGRRVRADQLNHEDRIESAYRTVANQKGYIRVRSTSGDRTMEHYLTAEYDHGRRPAYPAEHGHHVNEVKDSNGSGNIAIVSSSLHNSEHMQGDKNPMRRWWKNATEEERARYHENMSASTSGEQNGMIGKIHRADTLEKIGAKTKERFNDPAFRERHSAGVRAANERRRAAKELNNHTVENVRVLNVTEDVYCGTVADTGRFFVSLGDDHYEGVLVSNCGEQPLPEWGACDLGSVIVAMMVRNPFTSEATFDWPMFDRAVHAGMRMLDNVLDVTNYPLEQQAEESRQKRRTGLGVTGFADALLQLGIRYGSTESLEFSHELARRLKVESYRASCELAKERGPFPMWDREKYMEGMNVPSLPAWLRENMYTHGMRNSVLNTEAPNGTNSIFNGNVSSGIEPHYSFMKTTRKVRQPDGSAKEYTSTPYAYRLYEAMHGPTPREALPDYFVAATDITPWEHVAVQAAWQQHIDAAISKTVNCPADLSYEAFKDVYKQAYDRGCKGCTTYRPDPASGRGSVLAEATKASGITASSDVVIPDVLPRPEVLDGRSYKLEWYGNGKKTNYYVTVTRDEHDRPMELFILTKDASHQEWVQALTRTVTAVLRRGGDVAFLADELSEVHSATGGTFIDQRYVPSVVAGIGGILRKEFMRLGLILKPDATDADLVISLAKTIDTLKTAETCPACAAPTWIREQGCSKCLSCDYTTCG